MPAFNTVIKVAIDEANKSRLAARTYADDYTPIPNKALPPELRGHAATLHQALGGGSLELHSFTFGVRAKDGRYQRVYGPALHRSEDNRLLIRWGSKDLPIEMEGSGLFCPDESVRLSFKDVIQDGKTCTVLAVSKTIAEGRLQLEANVIAVDRNHRATADDCEAMLEARNIQGLMGLIGHLGTGGKINGSVIKVSAMPLGAYQVTDFHTFEGGQYGPKTYFQITIPEGVSFDAVTKVRQPDNTWRDAPYTVTPGQQWVKGNKPMERIMVGKPVITPEYPATLHVDEHRDYNGHPMAVVRLKPSLFEPSDDALSLDF